jgi:Xaa-Pro dipeptidase
MTSPFSLENIQQRQDHLKSLLKAHGLSAFALNAGKSQAYLTGMHFHLMERPVVAILTPDKAPVLILPDFEKGKTEDLGYALRVFTYGEDPAKWEQSFRQAGAALGLSDGAVGVEENQMRVLELRYLEAALPNAAFNSAGSVIAEMRKHKDAGEIAAMQAAAKVAEQALEATLPMIKAGVTEKQIAAELVQNIFRHGSDPELPFSPIVAAGANSANPHATVSDRVLVKGDLLIIDWGASVDGYFSDITRTFAISSLDTELERIHEIVRLANQVGRQAARPGATCSSVDEATRDVIEDSGHGQYFTHRTGHGLGMEAHEEPYMRAGNAELLAEGMSFTVEPGIYLPGRGGVRIEDDVVITAAGAMSLTNFPRELQILG